jgi:hypothetical protein
MSIPSPHLNDFDTAKKIEKYQNRLLWTATALSVIAFVINVETIKIGIASRGWTDLADYFTKATGIIVSVMAIIYSILEFITQSYISSGGKKKRNDLIDNSFGSNLSGIRSSGYFSNSQLPDGIYKLAVNCFENSYFTATIISNMLWKKWLTTGALVIAIMLAAFSDNLGILNTLIQLSVTGIVLQQSIKMQWYYFKMNQIFEDFKTLFDSLNGIPDPEKRSPEILKNVLNYECTHAWGGVLNETQIYDALNPELSRNWETMKTNYNIR